MAQAIDSTVAIRLADQTLNALVAQVKSNEIQTLVDSLSNLRPNLIEWVHANISFAGFDAVYMREKLCRLLNGKQIVTSVLIGLVRGNNIDRIKTSMRSATAKTEFAEIVKTAKLKPRVGGDYKAVTLSRLVACFPEVVADILHHHTDLPMAVDYMSLKAVHAEYTSLTRHQVVACILPQIIDTKVLSKILDVFMVPYLMTSEQINQKNSEWKKKSKIDKATESAAYLNNSYNSKILSEPKRIELSEKYGIMHSGLLTAKWDTVSSRAYTWLKSNYSFSHKDAEE